MCIRDRARGGVVLAQSLVDWRRTNRGGYRPFLHHVTAGRATATRPLRLRQPRRLPRTLTNEQVLALFEACEHLRDRFLLVLLAETGIRIEELLELGHHALISYRLPTTEEVVPLLQIVPSKTDAERLLLVSPELADVLAAVLHRIRDAAGVVPLVARYDAYECVWSAPAPLLFQRRVGSEPRAMTMSGLRRMLAATLARTGLVDPATGGPLHFTPHDFRRMFLTDAIASGLPPHIAQVIAGHRDLNVTLGYKAVYPTEAIQAHRAFLARRRALRPSEEYRTPTDGEWQEFLGHFR